MGAQVVIPSWVIGLGGLLGTLVVIGTAIAVLRSSVQTKTTQLWKEQSEAFSSRLDECQSDGIEKDKKIEVLEARVSTLENTVGAGPAIEKLATAMAAQHTELLGYMEQLLESQGVKVRPRKLRGT